MNERKDELASFLRSRRRRLTPEDVGIARSGRRRIATLRREDVAWLADVGITWYTWLEQGRPIKVARETLKRIAQALRMDSSETEYLEKLVLRHEEPTGAWQVPVGGAIRSFVESQARGYACVLGPRRDILAANERFARLFGVEGSCSPAGSLERNALWIMFTGERARLIFPEWPAVARRLLATFRYIYGDYVGEPGFELLIAALGDRSSEFVSMWSDLDVLSPMSWSIDSVLDPLLDEIVALETVTLPVPGASGQTIVCSFPPCGLSGAPALAI